MGAYLCPKESGLIEEVVRRLNLNQGSRVLVKPNLVSQEPYPTTTDPQVLEAVLRGLGAVGCEVVLADGPAPDKSLILEAEPGTPVRDLALDFWGRFQRELHPDGSFPTEVATLVSEYLHRVVLGSELAQVAQRYGVEVREAGDLPQVKVRLDGVEVQVVDLSPFDVILNLPVLKLHTVCGFSGALKNFYGLVAPFDKMRLHVEVPDFSLAIRDLGGYPTLPVFTIMDTTRVPTAQERIWGDFRVLPLDTMILGDRMVEVDAMALKVLEDAGVRLPSNGLIQSLRGYSPYPVGR